MIVPTKMDNDQPLHVAAIQVFDIQHLHYQLVQHTFQASSTYRHQCEQAPPMLKKKNGHLLKTFFNLQINR